MSSALRGERPEGHAAADVDLDGRDGAARLHGTVRIAPAVLIELIDLTLAEIDGFAGLRNHDTDPDPGETGRRFSNGRIAVTVDGDRIAVAVGCAIVRGTKVAEFSQTVQQAIGFAVGNMLNMTVKSVDLIIQDVSPVRGSS